VAITGKPSTFPPSTHSHGLSEITGLETALAAKAPLASPTFTGTVSGITSSMVGLGNVPNVDATARANHTGTQAISTVSGLQDALDGKQAAGSYALATHSHGPLDSAGMLTTTTPVSPSLVGGPVVFLDLNGGIGRGAFGSSAGQVCQGNDSRLSDSREWSADTISQAEAEAGTGTTRRAFTAIRVFQAVAAWWAGSAAKTKLDGIAANATANATDAQLRDRSTHTGTQAASTISDFAAAVAAASPEEVVEYLTPSAFPASGNGSLLYIATDAGRAYRWVGAQYAEIGPSSQFIAAHTHDDRYYTEAEVEALATVNALIFG
jgi:hypothetical protein